MHINIKAAVEKNKGPRIEIDDRDLAEAAYCDLGRWIILFDDESHPLHRSFKGCIQTFGNEDYEFGSSDLTDFGFSLGESISEVESVSLEGEIIWRS